MLQYSGRQSGGIMNGRIRTVVVVTVGQDLVEQPVMVLVLEVPILVTLLQKWDQHGMRSWWLAVFW